MNTVLVALFSFIFGFIMGFLVLAVLTANGDE